MIKSGRLLNPAVDEGILMKALGLIINLLAEEEVWRTVILLC